MSKTNQKSDEQAAPAPAFDDVLKRMLASPPDPHVKKKPAGQTPKKKAAK